MLDNDHRVPEIAESAESPQQAVIVALMQADARFIKHVEHPCQSGADLRGKTDALRLAAGKRPAFTVEG